MGALDPPLRRGRDPGLGARHRRASSGVVNGAAPNPVTNKEWSKALGRALHRPAVLPIPGVAVEVKFGSEFGKVAQGGQRALPKRTEELGYAFKFPEIDGALRDLVG